MISVVVPTIRGRERHLERCLSAYRSHTEDFELIVVPDAPTCGIAWQKGSERFAGDYLHFSADDLEPRAGWWQAAVETVERGFLPAPRILNPDGTLQSCGEWGVEQATGDKTEFTRIPFMSRAQWELIGPMIPIHYFTDNWVSYRGRQHGIETGVHRDYLFVHSFAREGRVDHRMGPDSIEFERYCSGELRP